MPYIDPGLYLGGRAEAFREALEQFDCPVRVLNGNARTYVDVAWTAEQREANGNPTIEECNERGVTLVSYGTLHDARYHILTNLPVVAEGYANGFTYYDALAFPEDTEPWLARPLEAADADGEIIIVGEIAEGIVLLHGDLLAYDIDYEQFVVEPLKRCRDEEFVRGIADAQEAHNREAFMRFAVRANDAGLEQARREVAELMSSEARHRLKLSNAMRDLRNKQRQLDMLIAMKQEQDGDVENKLLDSWTQLNEDPRIERVIFNTDKQLLIETGPVDLTHPLDGRVAYLGRFRWTIDIGTNEIHLRNLDNARGGFDHPHCNLGQPCFGEMGDTIYEMLNGGDLYAAVEMMFAFLATINLHDDWSRRATFWFDDDRERTPDAVTPIAVEA